MEEKVQYNRKFNLYCIFKAERIREARTAEEIVECRVNPAETKRIRLIFNLWKKHNALYVGKHPFTADEVIVYMTNEFGAPENGTLWPTIKVFLDDDDAKEWDIKTTASS
jgi:hypothetical protein